MTCNKTAMNPERPGIWLVPKSVDAGASVGDSTAAWVNETDGKLYSVQANIKCPRNPDGSIDQTCTYKATGGTYQALLFRTKNDSSPFAWEFVSVFWDAPPTQSNPHMGFTNCPDAFPLPDGRWAFAYLSHATSYAPTRILWFTGTCDPSFQCHWNPRGGMVDASPSYIASQSFTDSLGRRVIWGWIGGHPTGANFAGLQSIPRMIVSGKHSNDPLRFLPLPELAVLHAGPPVTFNLSMSPGARVDVLANATTNSFHLTVTVDVAGYASYYASPNSRSAVSNADLTLYVFSPPPTSSSSSSRILQGETIALLPPHSTTGQRIFPNTDTTSSVVLATLRPVVKEEQTAEWCAARCVDTMSCGGWTFSNSTVGCTDSSQYTCTLRGEDASFIADAGSGCLGMRVHNLTSAFCSSGLVRWQLALPALKQPLPVSPGPHGNITLEIFVDQIVVEVFLHDFRGEGIVVSTFGTSFVEENATAVVLATGTSGLAGVGVSGSLWEMEGSISPPP